jgi:hypothetical protein
VFNVRPKTSWLFSVANASGESPEVVRHKYAQADRRRYRVIIDEAQCIKNRQTVGSKAAHDLMATHRIVMTGTPMMNTIDELYPLIRFLDIPP